MKIKALYPTNGGYHSYGPEHEVRVSAKTALALLRRQHPDMALPKLMGYGIDVAFDATKRLVLQVHNRSGEYFVCSPNVTIGQWPELFNAEIV